MRKMIKFQPKVCDVTFDPTGIREQRKQEAAQQICLKIEQRLFSRTYKTSVVLSTFST